MNTHNPHPLEVGAAAVLVVIEAAAVMVVALVALALALSGWSPAVTTRAGDQPSPDRVMPAALLCINWL